MDIQIFDHLTRDQYRDVEALERLVFPTSFRAGHFIKEAPEKDHLMALLAYDERTLVAYKVGYQLKSDTFYSWVGGVHPDYRKQGLAQKLMTKQHQILQEKGFQRIRTKTRMGYRGMLILNIKSGFDITGVSTKPHIPGLIIQMEKSLGA